MNKIISAILSISCFTSLHAQESNNIHSNFYFGIQADVHKGIFSLLNPMKPINATYIKQRNFEGGSVQSYYGYSMGSWSIRSSIGYAYNYHSIEIVPKAHYDGHKTQFNIYSIIHEHQISYKFNKEKDKSSYGELGVGILFNHNIWSNNSENHYKSANFNNINNEPFVDLRISNIDESLVIFNNIFYQQNFKTKNKSWFVRLNYMTALSSTGFDADLSILTKNPNYESSTYSTTTEAKKRQIGVTIGMNIFNYNIEQQFD